MAKSTSKRLKVDDVKQYHFRLLSGRFPIGVFTELPDESISQFKGE